MRPILLTITGAAMLLASMLAVALALDRQGCVEYAIWSRDLVWARDIGADRELTRDSLTEMRAESDSPVFVLLLRDLDKLFDTRASRNDVMQGVARDCIGRRGKYADETGT